MRRQRVLCIDDESYVLSVLRRTLESGGFKVFTASSGRDALIILEKEMCDVALVDYKMPDISGLELVKKVKENGYNTELIMVTGFYDVSLIVRAIKEGACDYIVKPWNKEHLISTINKALKSKLAKKNRFLKNRTCGKYKYKDLIGSSQSMKIIFSIIEKIKDSNTNVFIHGENGTGKEQIAKAIHYSGNRRDRLFIPVDCASINPNIIESELFGHVKGAFTGAFQTKEGLLKSAGKGTIFLDEIAEVPPNIQAKLLRALQEMEVKPVGSNKMVKVEARIIAATNKKIYKAIEKGEFREDLFYRLNVVSLEVPPLREHKKDILPLVDHFIEKHNTDEKEIKGITEKAMHVLMDFDWPGNIRQLEHCIERAILFSTEEFIDINDLPNEIISKKRNKNNDLVIKVDDLSYKALSKRDYGKRVDTLQDVEREYIIETILRFKYNKKKAAEAMGIRRSTLYNRLKKLDIDL